MATNRVDARQLVEAEHEEHDEREADDRGQDARPNRVGAERRADGALLEIGQRRRQRT